MNPKDQVAALIGSINLLGEIRDELWAKELHGAGDEIVRVQTTLRRQLHSLIDEAKVNKVALDDVPYLHIAGRL